MKINSVEEIFLALEKLGFNKKETESGWHYTLDSAIGDGYIEVIGNIHTYYLIRGHFFFHTSKHLKLDVDIQDRFIELSYVKTAISLLQTKANSDAIHLEGLSCKVHVSDGSFDLIFPKEQSFDYYNIILRESYLEDFFPIFYSKYIEKAAVYLNGPLHHPKIVAIIDDLFQRNHWTYAGQLYFNSKIIELLSLLIGYLDAVHDTSNTFNPSHLAILKKAKNYIETHYISPPTLDALAVIVGSNTKLLKEGFKTLYGITIYQHIRHIRMQKVVSY